MLLALDGIATVAEVYLNGELVLESDSMFAEHRLDVGAQLRGAGNELAVCCRALGPRLKERRRPRARWRTRLVSEGNLRFFRTMLLGRTPGMAPQTAAVGPWRGARLERSRAISIEQLALRPRLDGSDGVLAMRLQVAAIGAEPPARVQVTLDGPTGERQGELELSPGRDGAGRTLLADGEIRIPGVAPWWPHTHGEPGLCTRSASRFSGGGEPLTAEAGRVGFRSVSASAGGTADVRARTGSTCT